ncbi:phage terminase large subunit family protein [Undibacterium sp. FT147W]|uniref:Phage terminase large subunit family protein n=1 Tax=Undibacterium rivi TaxID=2828729 RepID=A0ABS5H1Q3_9BURK|nr:phage terminase large subunit family protein [Undibacterium rivi]MBR7792317.1 phage terminase large subunit family protein [Undibacterium rivi]
MTPANTVIDEAFARGLQPDPNMTVDEWSDRYMIIPKDSGANEYGKYRTSKTPHARRIMQALSDSHPCKRVVLMGASQMMKTQVGLNWFACSVHQSPANFLWILPTGKLAKRTSTRIAKTIAAVPELTERVAAPRSRDSVNTLDTKDYTGGSLFIVTAGAAANLAEVPARRVLFDEVDRADANVNGEGDPVALAEARQTTFERNKKSYYPCSPTITGESIVETLYEKGTKHVALAECVHCGHPQPLVFERLKLSDDGQDVVYPCEACFEVMYESDKNKMFVNGLWSDGVAGDGETESFTIPALFISYGGMPWKALWNEYKKAKEKLAEGSEEKMIAFYNTRLARCWERAKEQTQAKELQDRAEDYRLGIVPRDGLILTASVDTQPDRYEMKVVAWGEGMESWIVDYQIILGSPSDEETNAKLDKALEGRYQHECGTFLSISSAFIDSGGANTQDVYNFTRVRRHRHIFAIKGASQYNKPILSAKPTPVDVSWQGKTEVRGAQLWLIGTDTAKDYLSARYKLKTGPGAVHFSKDLPEEYFKQLTAEYRIHVYKRGRKVSIWDKKQSDRNEAGDLMVYNLAVAYYLGLHKKTPHQWQMLRDYVDPQTKDLFSEPITIKDSAEEVIESAFPAIQQSTPWTQTTKPQASQSRPANRTMGRAW